MLKDYNTDSENKETHATRGNEYAMEGRYNEAIECYDKVIEIDPQFSSAWNDKGAVLLALGRNNESLSCLEKSIEIDPNYDLAWCNICEALVKLDEQEEARECLDNALNLATSPQTKANLAEISLMLKEYEKFQSLVKEVIHWTNEKDPFRFIMRFFTIFLAYLLRSNHEGKRALLDLLQSCESGSIDYRKLPWNFDNLRKMIEDSNLSLNIKEGLVLLTTLSEARTNNDAMVTISKIRNIISHA
jgi:tetratricopeptide (TPR) repeat protein